MMTAPRPFGIKRFWTCAALSALGICLASCSSDGGEGTPDLGQIKKFHSYAVYYSGVSVEGNPLNEIQGRPDAHENPRDTNWFLLYGECKNPPDEGGCQLPLQIHNYSTCTRWADPESRLFDLRGAKAAKISLAGSALEIFTGRTTVSVTAINPEILRSAIKALRDVRQSAPARLPPPAPGSLEGQLACQH